MRSFLAGLLATVGLLLLPAADLGVWTRRSVVSTDGFNDLALDVLHEPEVGAALGERLTDELEARDPRLGAARFVVVRATTAVTAGSAFETVFRAAVGTMHDQLQDGSDSLTLDLDPVLPLVREQVARVDAGVAERIPTAEELPAITVLNREDAPELWDAIRITREATIAVVLATLVALAGAVALARRRGVMLATLGVGAVVLAILVIGALQLGQEPLSHVAGRAVDVDAFDAGYDVIAGSITRQTVILAVVGALTGAAGLGGIILYDRRIKPTGWA